MRITGWNLTVPDVIVQVECPLRNAQDNRMVYDMLWSDPAVADPVLAHGRFKLALFRVLEGRSPSTALHSTHSSEIVAKHRSLL